MVTMYVNKSGNDSNDGLTRATAKLTIGAAITAAGNSSTVWIGAGSYSEVIVSSRNDMDIRADFDDAHGSVIIDGTGVGPDFYEPINTTSGIRFYGLVFQNWSNTVILSLSGRTNYVTMDDCVIRNCHTGLEFSAGGTGGLRLVEGSRNVLIHDCDFGINMSQASGNTAHLRSWTFYNCGTAIFHRSNSALWPLNIERCVFSKGTTFVDGNTSLDRYQSDNNVYRFTGTEEVVLQGVSYTTLATLQSGGGDDANSTDADPVFSDEAKRLLRLDGTSTVLGKGYTGNEAVGISNNRNAALWTGAVLSNTTLNASNNYEISSGTDGTVAPDVIDFGKRRLIKRIVLKGITSYPSEVFDQDNTDTQPNRPQIEWRGSDTAFLKTDGTPAWNVAVNGELLNQTFRYLQVRVTLRNNGVAA